ncbi:MAG: hypothetical protein ABIP68_03245 [Ferruginibacter sp.]
MEQIFMQIEFPTQPYTSTLIYLFTLQLNRIATDEGSDTRMLNIYSNACLKITFFQIKN